MQEPPAGDPMPTPAPNSNLPPRCGPGDEARVIALVLNWNGADDTLACLRSLASQTHEGLEVLVIDNGSEDDSVARIRAEMPQVEMLELAENVGYAGGNNEGLRIALERRADFVFVLNNDTVLEPGCVSALLCDAIDHPEAGAIAPKSLIHDHPELVYFAGGGWDSAGYPRMMGFWEPDGPAFGDARETDWLNGCALFFRREALQQVGLFDDRFFLTFEDTDWSLRARAMGYRLRVVPDARLAHRISRSFGSSATPDYLYYYTRNHLLLIRKHHRGSERLRRIGGALSRVRRALKRASKVSMPHLRDSCRAVLQAWLDHGRGRYGRREPSTGSR